MTVYYLSLGQAIFFRLYSGNVSCRSFSSKEIWDPVPCQISK
jgi:hypothetical protein